MEEEMVSITSGYQGSQRPNHHILQAKNNKQVTLKLVFLKLHSFSGQFKDLCVTVIGTASQDAISDLSLSTGIVSLSESYDHENLQRYCVHLWHLEPVPGLAPGLEVGYSSPFQRYVPKPCPCQATNDPKLNHRQLAVELARSRKLGNMTAVAQTDRS